MGMIVASVADCMELHRRSGWQSQYFFHSKRRFPDGSEAYVLVGEHEAPFVTETYPAYDVGFLVAWLPAHKLIKRGNVSYLATWRDEAANITVTGDSRTNPANALCRLAVKLIERGTIRTD